MNRTTHPASTIGDHVLRAGLAACLIAASAHTAAGTPGRPGNAAGHAAVPPSLQAASAVAASQQVWRGATLDEWNRRWWRWNLSIPVGADPNSDTEGVDCGVNQDGDVWFLAGPLAPGYSRTCVIPAGKAILSAVVAFIDDFPCPNPDFKPPAGQSLEAFLRADVGPYIDAVSLATATLDGKPLKVRRVATGLFGFTGAASLSAYDPCITGSPQLGVSDGYWVTIDPPAPGTHTLHIRSSSPFGQSEGTFTLVIR
jgi:hypothetical protein